MKLPNVEAAVVSDDKITGYLLSPTHRDGHHKAAFFLGFGFTRDAGQTLAAALLRHAADHEVARWRARPLEPGTSWKAQWKHRTDERRAFVRCGFWKPVRTYHALSQPIHSKEQTND